MLGRRDPQRGLYEGAAAFDERDLERMGPYAELARNGHEIFSDDEFASMYCEDNGRPSVPPSLLALATLLQYFEGISDHKAVERTQFDSRWKVALDLDPCSTAPAFAKSTLQLFRARLALHDKEAVAFEASLRLAKEAGILPKRLRLALDSSPVRGRGAIRDTYNLLSDAIRAVVRSVAAAAGREAVELARDSGLERHLEAPSLKGSEELDWSAPEELSAFLGRLLEECRRAIALAREAGAAAEQVELLERIIAQDVETGEEGQAARLRQGVARDRVYSVTDPEMRCRHGSHSKKVVGHKAHVATDIESGIITATTVTGPSDPEGGQIEPLVRDTEELTGEETVDGVMGDCAYSTRRSVAAAERAGVELQSRMPRLGKNGFGPDQFEVSADRRQATCPAGHPSVTQVKSRDSIVHRWSEALCGACPLKDRCTRGKARSLSVAPDFHDRRRRERWARSPEGRRTLRERVVVEHSIGHLKNRGGRRARYFGRAKTRMQYFWLAAVANLLRIWSASSDPERSAAASSLSEATIDARSLTRPAIGLSQALEKLATRLASPIRRVALTLPRPAIPAST